MRDNVYRLGVIVSAMLLISGLIFSLISCEILDGDRTPPTVVSVSPEDGAVGVPVNTSIIVIFSETMDESATQSALIMLPEVSREFSWAGQSTILTFKPDKNLSAETKYTVTISPEAKDLAGNKMKSTYTWSFTTGSAGNLDTTPPGDVSNFAATPGDGKVYLSWANPADADFVAVKILFKTDGYPANPMDGTEAYNGAGTSYSHTGLTNGTTYYYTAFTYDGNLNYSTGVKASATPTEFPGSVPSAPSGLSASAVSSSQIDLSWTDNSNNENGFKIESKMGAGGTYSQTATVGPDVTTYSDTGLSPSTTYYYRVRAYNTYGDSVYSNEANATTQSESVWTQVHSQTTAAHSKIIVFGAYLYVFYSDATNWRTSNGTDWSEYSIPGVTTWARPLTVYNGQLYIAADNPSGGWQVWRTPDAVNWEKVYDSTACYFQSACEFNGYIYLGGTDGQDRPAQVWRSPSGNSGTWQQLVSNGFGDYNYNINSMVVFNNALYVSTWNHVNGCKVYKTTDGTTFTKVGDGFGSNEFNDSMPIMVVYNGELYAGTYTYGIGCQVWKNPGNDTWTQVNTNAFGGTVLNNGSNMTGVYSLGVFGNSLYAGAGGGLNAGGSDVPYIFRYNGGTSWELINQPGFGQSNNGQPRYMTVFNGKLYFSTYNSGAGSQVWQYSP